ncbi:MAG: glycosyltransferase family 4 protein [Thermoplasmatales archaeon]
MQDIVGKNQKRKPTFTLYNPFFEFQNVHIKKDIACIPEAYGNRDYDAFLLIGRVKDMPLNRKFKIVQTGHVNRFNPVSNLREFFAAIRYINTTSNTEFLMYNTSALGLPVASYIKIKACFRHKYACKTILKMDSDGTLNHGSLVNFLYKVLLYFGSFFFDSIITESSCGKKAVIRYVSNSKKVKIVQNGYSKEFYPVIPYGDNRERIIITVSRITRTKGIMELLLIYKEIVPVHPEWKLLVIGLTEDPKYLEELKGFVMRNNMEDSVSFLIDIDEGELKSYYAKASIFCSLSSLEGFSNARIEAVARGVPLFVSEAGCGRDLKGAVVVDPNDLETSAEKLAVLMKDENLRKRISIIQQKNLSSWEEVIEKF